jgi:hypothetical protein
MFAVSGARFDALQDPAAPPPWAYVQLDTPTSLLTLLKRENSWVCTSKFRATSSTGVKRSWKILELRESSTGKISKLND